LAELAGLKNLRELRIDRSALTEAGLKHLAGMKHLEHLSLKNCHQLNRAELAGLGALDSLRTLELYSPVSAAGLANVARLGALEKLTLAISSDLKPADVEPLARLTHLETLRIGSIGAERSEDERADRLREVPLGNAVGRVAGRLPNLRILGVGTTGTAMDNNGLAALVAPGKLQDLRLELVDVDDQSLKLVSQLSGLRRLRIVGEGKLSDVGLAHLGKLTQLVGLNLPAAGLTDAGLSQLAPLATIEELDLAGGEITGAGLAALGRWTALKTLHLPRSSFDDAGCHLLPQFAQLQSLDLSKTKITDAGLESVGKLSTLIRLNVSGNKAVTDVGLAHLEHLEHLRFIELYATDVRGNGVARLRDAIPGMAMPHRSAPWDELPGNTPPRRVHWRWGNARWDDDSPVAQQPDPRRERPR
jgi:Leucine-rich repeat (LRR) protein